MRANWSTVSILVPLRRHHRHTQGCATVFPFLTPIMFPFPMPITTAVPAMSEVCVDDLPPAPHRRIFTVVLSVSRIR